MTLYAIVTDLVFPAPAFAQVIQMARACRGLRRLAAGPPGTDRRPG